MVTFEGQQVAELAQALGRAYRVSALPEEGDGFFELGPSRVDVAGVARGGGEITQRVGHGTRRSHVPRAYERLLEELSVCATRSATVPVGDRKKHRLLL